MELTRRKFIQGQAVVLTASGAGAPLLARAVVEPTEKTKGRLGAGTVGHVDLSRYYRQVPQVK